MGSIAPVLRLHTKISSRRGWPQVAVTTGAPVSPFLYPKSNARGPAAAPLPRRHIRQQDEQIGGKWRARTPA